MRKQSALTANMTGGLQVSLDPAFLADMDSPNLSCVRFDKGLVKKDMGSRAFGDGNIADYVVHIDQFAMRDGSIHYLFANPAEMFKYVEANQAFVSIQAANSNFTGNQTDRFSSTQMLDANGNSVYIVTNGVDPIQKWYGANALAPLGGLANVANTAKIVTTFKNFCVMGNSKEAGAFQPTRIRWSALADPEEWEDTANGAGFVELIDSPDHVKAFLNFKERLIIFKEKSIWELVYVGYPNWFTPVRLLDGVGCLGADFPKSLGDMAVFFGTDGFYYYDTYTLKPLSDKVYPWLYISEEKLININRISQARALYVDELSEYWLSAPTVGDLPDTVFKVNVKTGAWTRRKQEVTAFNFYSIASGVAWWDMTDTWANQTRVWVPDKSVEGALTILSGDSQGIIKEDDRRTEAVETMWYETKDFMWAHAQRIAEIRVEAKYGPFVITYSTDSGETWSEPVEFAYQDEFVENVLYLNITTAKLRIRIQCEADWLEVKWIEPFYIPRVRSITLAPGALVTAWGWGWRYKQEGWGYWPWGAGSD